jgi:hypothetical protein
VSRLDRVTGPFGITACNSKVKRILIRGGQEGEVVLITGNPGFFLPFLHLGLTVVVVKICLARFIVEISY